MMDINRIKETVNSNLNKKLKFRFNGNRNMVEEFTGTIIKTYNFVFLIKVQQEEVIRSFSYSDILIGSLELNV